MWKDNFSALLLLVISINYVIINPGVIALQHGERDSFAKFKIQLEPVSGFIPFPSFVTTILFLGPSHSWNMSVCQQWEISFINYPLQAHCHSQSILVPLTIDMTFKKKTLFHHTIENK